MKKSIDIIVSSGQYETCADVITVTYTTVNGLRRRLRQLQVEHAVYGDNWAGWINAQVALAHPDDQWGPNQIIGGSWCQPRRGWLDLDEMTLSEMQAEINWCWPR